jgi:hypothetical protein
MMWYICIPEVFHQDLFHVSSNIWTNAVLHNNKELCLFSSILKSNVASERSAGIIEWYVFGTFCDGFSHRKVRGH